MIYCPQIVRDYLDDHRFVLGVTGYLHLDMEGKVIEGSGQLHELALSAIPKDSDITSTLSFMEGLLPIKTQSPGIIKNVHLSKEYYFDIHMFEENSSYWVLFIDTTSSARVLETKQQSRLDSEIEKQNRKSSG